MFSRFRQTRLSRQHLFHALLRGNGRRSAQSRQLSLTALTMTAHTDSLEVRVMLAGDMWMPLGPFSASNGQVENVGTDDRVVGAGHVVLAHPTNADTIYIGGTNGGIWRTTNATATNPNWTPLIDDQESLSIGAMAFDVADATSQTIVAGIGRYSSFGRTGGDRTGLLRTTDGGDTWQPIDGGGVLRGKNISGIYANGNTIVVSVNVADSFTYANIGIFRSTDGGASFSQISGGNGAATGLPGGVSYDMVADPVNAGVLYTSTVFSGGVGGQNGIFRSADEGATWSRVSDATIEALATDSTSNLELAVGRHNNVYAAVIVSGNPVGFFRSGDNGATWTQLDSPSTNENGTDVGLNPRGQKGPDGTATPEEIAGGQGSIHFSMAADPNDANIVFVGGDRQPRTFGDTGGFPNSIGATDFSGRLFRGDATQAAGSQWVHITHSNTLGAAGGGTASSSSPHADSRDMAFDANGNLIEVDDGGIYRRTQPNSNQGDWFALTGDLQITEAHDVAWDAISNVAMTGNQDTGTTYQTSEGSPLWTSLSTGDGGDIAIDDVSLAGSNRSIRYTSFQNLGAFRRSTWDAAGNLIGQTFPSLTVTAGAALQPSFVTPVVLNAIDPTRLIIQGSNSVYESPNQGNSIAEVGAGIGFSGGQSGIAYGGVRAGVPNADVLWATNSNDVFFRSTAGALAPVASDVTSGSILDLAINLDDWGEAFVIDDNQVAFSGDEGQNWQDITGSLAGVVDGFRSLAYVAGPTVDAVLLGTGAGLFAAATSAMTTWVPLGTGIPNVPIYDLEYDVADNVLVAGTLGRGAWILNDIVGAVERVFSPNVDPVIDDQTFSIAENEPNATVVGTVVATDSDAGQTLTYAITAGNGNAPGVFAIDNNGQLTVNDSTQLDFETTQQYQLTVLVTDDGSPAGSDTATITINVTDVDEINDAPVVNFGLTGAGNRADLYGTVGVAQFGEGVAGVGDVNNDGFDDFLVASTRETGDANASGVARVFSGRDGALLHTLNGVGNSSSFGQAAAGIGDINADGHDDFIIGAPDEQAGQGAARVYSGVDGSVLFTYTGINSSAGLGRSVAAAGDVNNDGVGDFIVGAPDEEVGGVPLHGVVAVYSGVDGTELRRFEGDDFFQYYGTAVAPAGDVNNDGFDDIIVGAGGGGTSTHGSIGFAEIRSGADGSILRTFTGTGAQDRFGDSIANIGDITGDGFDDFAIGEPLGDGNGAIREGLVFVLNGQTGAEVYRLQGTDFASRFGQSVSSAGDFNRDGTTDIIVSASQDSTGLGLAGSVWIYSGADGSLLYQEDGEFGDQLGNSVANAGDLNNDGVDEVIFGASGVDTSVISGGKASILYSSPVTDDPPANFVEGGGPINVVDNLSIIDEDDLNLTQAVVQITGNYLNTEDVLAISGAAPLGISVSAFNTVTGAITLTGTASIGAYIQTLKLITYNNTAVTSTATRTVTLTVIDENSVNDPVGMLMGADTRDILVFRVNNDPVIDDQTFSIDENSPNTTLVGNVVANDPDAGQTLTYAITAGNGVAPGAFTIDATGALRVNDSAQIDFETTSTFTLTVQVTDDGFPALSDTATITVNVRDIDEPPTIVLANTTNTLPEDTDTSSRIKVADIVVTDDATGTSTLSLSGADAALFEISGTELFLIAGAALDFETNPSLDVTVNVDDPALGGSPDNSASLSIAVTDVNEPPTIALLNTVTFLAESTDTSARIKVADVVVTDDAIGANVLGLTGSDAALFQLVGLELYLIAGATLDFESNPVLDVTVTVDDAAIGTTPDDSADLAIAITDGNEPPSVSLANVIGPLAENTDTSSRIKVADIVVTDDALGSFTLSLSGANASFFEIAGTELFLSAGVSLDFETRPVLNVVVSVDDATVGATPDDSAVLSLPIADVNEPPAIALVNTVTSLAEDILTTSPVKVANIVIIDDALGTNTLSLTGADAALFQIVGTELFLVAGAVLDFETKPVLNVTVVLDDTAVGATPDGTADLTINITDASDPPTVTLANTVTSLPENTDTTARTRVADIIITDDALGTNTLSLTGADAALFEIVGNQLFIIAGAGIDFETNPALDVTVNVDDASVGASPDDNASLSISVSDVNEAPTVALANTITTLSESTDTSAQIKVADIVITDDAVGTNTLSLSGADAGLFEVVGTQLFLVAGAALDFETNPVLDVTVNVDDMAIGATPDDTADLVVTVTDIDEPPVVTLTNVTTNLPEDTDTSSRIKVADIVVIDDVGGVSTLSLSGADQELFEIDGLELFLKAGTTLFERTNPVLDVSVSVDDPTIGGTPDDTALLSIIVDRVYQDPVVEHGTEGVIVRTGRAARRLMPNASVKDLDSTNLNGGRVTVEIKFSNITDEITFLQRTNWRFRQVGQGMFEISQGQTPVANATISFDSFTSIRTINLQLLEGATPHKTSVVLRSILFRRTDRETAAPRVTVTVEDIQGLTGRTTKRLLQWVSKEPGRYWSPDFTQSYTIGSGPLQVTGEASLVDLDGPDYGGGRITAVLSGPTFEEFDRLSIATGGNLVINGNKVEIGGQAVATVTATDNRRIKMNLLPGATTEHVSTIIEALRYEYTGTLPRFVSKQVNLWIRDPNGLLVQTAANSIPRHQINISNVPATLANSGPAVRYLPGSAPVRTAPAIDVIDDFQTENPIATVRLTNARAGDRLDLIPRSGEPLSIVGGSLVMNGQVVGTVENRVTSISISFTAEATRSAILKALRAISFSSSSTTPEGIRNLRYEYQDAQASSDTLDAQLDVTIPSELLDAAIALS